MVSRQETARQLLTPGEVMQLPPDDEVVMVSGHPPVRAKKLRFYSDANFKPRLLPPPSLSADGYADKPAARGDDWSDAFDEIAAEAAKRAAAMVADEDEGGLRRQPELDMTVPQAAPVEEERQHDVGSLLDDDDADIETERTRAVRAGERQLNRAARNAALDPDDGIAL